MRVQELVDIKRIAANHDEDGIAYENLILSEMIYHNIPLDMYNRICECLEDVGFAVEPCLDKYRGLSDEVDSYIDCINSKSSIFKGNLLSTSFTERHSCQKCSAPKKNSIIECYFGEVFGIVMRYCVDLSNVPDLVQECMIMVYSIYDEYCKRVAGGLNTQFSSYLVGHVKAVIDEYNKEENLHERCSEYSEMCYMAYCNSLDTEELAELLSGRYSLLKSNNKRYVSLDPVSYDYDIEGDFIRREAVEMIMSRVRKLVLDLDLQVTEAYYVGKQTYASIGLSLGVSGARVRQRVRKSYIRIKSVLNKYPECAEELGLKKVNLRIEKT